jgi:predicted GNAT family N-acyltransferase
MSDIRLATVADADEATAILSDGFRDDPVMVWLYGDNVTAALPVMFDFMLGEALIPVGATYLSDQSCSVWTPPGQDPWSKSDELGARFMATMTDALPAHAMERLMVLGDVTDRVHPQEPHWYLGLLATRTRAQGSGAGSRMLERTLALVDEDGMAAYLESTNPRNVPFYERHGFVVTGEEVLPDGPRLTCMRRPPASQPA